MDQDEQRDLKIWEWQNKARRARKKKRNLYVITLNPEVLWRKEFRHANPGYVEGLPCLYVGMTIHEPGDRFEQHILGYKSSKYPRNFGVELAMDLIDGFDSEDFKPADQEEGLANWLRDQGFAVWQN